MKNKSILFFWIIILTIIIGVFIFQYNTPKKFIWKPTYSKYDKQPFGSFVFDDVMASSIQNYSLENKTFYQLYTESFGIINNEDEYYEETYADEHFAIDYEEAYDGLSGIYYEDTIQPLPEYQRKAYLVTEQSVDFTDADVTALLNMVKQGNKVMLCLASFPATLRDSLYFTTEYTYFYSVAYLERYAKEGNQRDSLFMGIDSLKPERIFEVYPHLHPVYIKPGRSYYSWEERDTTIINYSIKCDSLETIVWNNEWKPVGMRLFLGQGELFLITTPLLFTNYGILDGKNASYAFNLLSYMADMPVIRLEAYGINNQPSRTPLRYFLLQPSLRWAVYLTVILIILFMVFTAKRRQRIIPVVNPPVNQTMRFTQLIGNLYYQKKDYKDILRKKYRYFCVEVKQLNGLDLQSDETDEDQCRKLAGKMGLNMNELWPEFRELKHVLKDDVDVNEDMMVRNINRMNKWKSNLYN